VIVHPGYAPKHRAARLVSLASPTSSLARGETRVIASRGVYPRLYLCNSYSIRCYIHPVLPAEIYLREKSIVIAVPAVTISEIQEIVVDR